ncbi:glycosyl hydrolase [Paenibacillus contaminans]|nr:glycosyl hydrolase [Paenibacillus contaminans]
MLSFWFLNHDLEDDELRWQLDEMKAKRFTGIFIHPRDGLNVPYATELWFAKVSVILEHCGRIGLQAWLYDEEPFPSGAAGGQVFFDKPEFKARYLTMERFEVQGGRVKLDFAPGRFLKTVAIRHTRNGLSREWLDLTEHTGLMRSEWTPGIVHHGIYYPPYEDSGNPHWRSGTIRPHYRVDCELPEGDWTVCAFVEREMTAGCWGAYTDLMNPDATRHFIALTHEKYAKRYKHLFGGVIPGIFTDEFKVIHDVAWSPVLSPYFHGKFGYELEERLPDLFLTIDDGTAQVRYDYRLALSKLLKSSFIEPVVKWCEANRLVMTGHISPEEDPVGQTKWTPHLLSLLKGFHLPGTDLIAGQIGSAEYPLLHLGPKMASSAARHTGKRESLVEAFGANGWETDFKSMIKMADWLFVLGVTEVVVHGQFYSIDGLRKKEAPPSYFYQSSHWPYFGEFSDYILRMSALLKEGEPRCRLLVYYPQAAFSALVPDRFDEADEQRRKLGALLHELLSNQWDFDLVDEQTLLEMSVKDGRLQGVSNNYDVLLLPYCDVMESGAARFCAALTRQGIAVWRVGEQPTIVASEGESRFNEAMRLADCHDVFWSKVVPAGQVAAELHKALARDITLWSCLPDGTALMEPAKVYVHARAVGSTRRMMVTNALDETQWTQLKHPSCDECGTADVVLTCKLPPNGSILVDVHPDRLELLVAAGHWSSVGSNPLGTALHSVPDELDSTIDLTRDWQLKPEADNVLILSHWHFRETVPQEEEGITAAPAVNMIENPGPVFEKEGYGYCRFYSRGTPGPTHLVYELSAWEGDCRIVVNGKPVQPARKVRRYDVNNFEMDITPFLHKGIGRQTNIVEVRFSSGGRLKEPFRLYGEFEVTFPYAGFPPGQLAYGQRTGRISELDSWDDLGFPHYAGTMTYIKDVTLQEEWLRAADGNGSIWLQAAEVNDVARLFINGVEQGTRLCEPFAWNVTNSLKSGSNRIAFEVANSPIAFFEGGRKRAGLRGKISLSRFLY